VTRPPVLLSSPLDNLAGAARVADGIEVKLDWEHARRLSSERQLADVCETQGVEADRLVSVYLPPGMNRANGMSIAPGNIGKILEFTHSAFGDEVSPEWLTVHTARRFDYREHVERLATITDVTGYRLAVENTPDRSHYHEPEELALLAFLADRVDRLSDTYVLVDTAHVPDDRRSFDVDEGTIRMVMDRLDSKLRSQIGDAFRNQIEEAISKIDIQLPAHDPWRPAILTLNMIGGHRVRAIHLNDPVTDGLPSRGHEAAEGLDIVLRFCCQHNVSIVLEPVLAEDADIRETVRGLQECLSPCPVNSHRPLTVGSYCC
jgi:hypothetical protein